MDEIIDFSDLIPGGKTPPANPVRDMGEGIIDFSDLIPREVREAETIAKFPRLAEPTPRRGAALTASLLANMLRFAPTDRGELFPSSIPALTPEQAAGVKSIIRPEMAAQLRPETIEQAKQGFQLQEDTSVPSEVAPLPASTTRETVFTPGVEDFWKPKKEVSLGNKAADAMAAFGEALLYELGAATEPLQRAFEYAPANFVTAVQENRWKDIVPKTLAPLTQAALTPDERRPLADIFRNWNKYLAEEMGVTYTPVDEPTAVAGGLGLRMLLPDVFRTVARATKAAPAQVAKGVEAVKADITKIERDILARQAAGGQPVPASEIARAVRAGEITQEQGNALQALGKQFQTAPIAGVQPAPGLTINIVHPQMPFLKLAKPQLSLSLTKSGAVAATQDAQLLAQAVSAAAKTTPEVIPQVMAAAEKISPKLVDFLIRIPSVNGLVNVQMKQVPEETAKEMERVGLKAPEQPAPAPVQSALADLVSEARKYKTAEEWKKAIANEPREITPLGEAPLGPLSLKGAQVKSRGFKSLADFYAQATKSTPQPAAQPAPAAAPVSAPVPAIKRGQKFTTPAGEIVTATGQTSTEGLAEVLRLEKGVGKPAMVDPAELTPYKKPPKGKPLPIATDPQPESTEPRIVVTSETKPETIRRELQKRVLFPNKEQNLAELRAALLRAAAVEKSKDKAREVVMRKYKIEKEDSYEVRDEKIEKREAELEQIRKSNPISIKVDGIWKVENSPNAINKVISIIQHPAPEPKGWSTQAPKKNFNPVAARKEDVGPLVEIKGGKYFTDARLAVKGQPPAKAKFLEGRPPMSEEDIKKILQMKTTPAELEFYFVYNENSQGIEPSGPTGVSDTPISGDGIFGSPWAVFKHNGKRVFYSQNKFNVIRNRYPDATYGIGKGGILVAYDGKEPVAALMPLSLEKSTTNVVGKYLKNIASPKPDVTVSKPTPTLVSKKTKPAKPVSEKRIEKAIAEDETLMRLEEARRYAGSVQERQGIEEDIEAREDEIRRGLQEPPDTNTRIQEIVRSAESMAAAQKQIEKELGLSFTIADLKKVEPQIKGGAPVNLAQQIIEDLVGQIKSQHPNVDNDYGLSKVVGVSPEELNDMISTFGIVKEHVREFVEAVKRGIYSLELPQNFLHAYPDTKPISDGVIDLSVKKWREESSINRLKRRAVKMSPEGKTEIAKLMLEADRDNKKNVFVSLAEAVKAGKISKADKDAWMDGYYYIWKFVRDRLIKEILDSRLGIRIKSEGVRYHVQYETAKGKISDRWVTAGQLENLQKNNSVNIVEEKERIELKHVDPDTGEYVSKKVLVNDYDEAVKMMTDEAKELIKSILPYRNYVPHNRKGGKFWVMAYEPLASGAGEQTIYAARVQTEAVAQAMAKAIKDKMPHARVEVNRHSDKLKFFPSFGTMADVEFFMMSNGIDPKSEAGQRIINAYRAMSPLMSHLIEAENIAGFKVDYDSIVEGMADMANAAVQRGFRGDIKELRKETVNIEDDFRYNVAVRYLDALSAQGESNQVLDAVRGLTYFWLLANKATYILQNLSEPIWALARLDKIAHPGKFLAPLSKDDAKLVKRAEEEGILTPFFELETIKEEGALFHLDVLGRGSEHISSRKVFEVGLRVARDKGLTGEDAYREAYQFLFNLGKPFYNIANKPIFTIGPGGETARRYAFVLLNWVFDFFNKAGRGGPGFVLPMKRILKTMLAWAIMAGFGTLPFGRRILKQYGLVPKDQERYTMKDRFLIGGIAGAAGISPGFLVPLFSRWFTNGEFAGTGTTITRAVEITVDRLNRVKNDYKKYGIMGALGNLPLAGAQYPILGAAKIKQGVKSGAKQPRVTFRPKTWWEKFLLAIGVTPFRLGEQYEKRRDK